MLFQKFSVNYYNEVLLQDLKKSVVYSEYAQNCTACVFWKNHNSYCYV